MKTGVVVFPGSNCDEDMVYVLSNILRQHVVKLWHKDHDLQDCDLIILPGGFSYGDYLRSGAIARFSPIMQEVISFANKGGFVFGSFGITERLRIFYPKPAVVPERWEEGANASFPMGAPSTQHAL